MSVSITPLGAEALERALSLRDLTDPGEGPHALQLLVAAAQHALAGALVVRGPRVVDAADNYDRLRIPHEAAARDARYTRYVDGGRVLRTHTSAMLPPALRALARHHHGAPPHTTLLAPGIVYRRDCIDRLHTGEPHQMDVWRLGRGAPDVDGTIAAVVTALLPGRAWRTTPTEHPYTLEGRQIDVADGEAWIEIGECGVAHPEVLVAAGLAPEVRGVAMGLGLDRLLMLRKRIPDIRLLRAEDARVARQMQDLEPYREVSAMPPARRDLSVAVDAGMTAEELGDRVRSALGARAAAVEEIAVVAETPWEALPDQARARIGLARGQKNVLVRVVLRDLERTLTSAEANALRNAIYAAIHEGSASMWAT